MTDVIIFQPPGAPMAIVGVSSRVEDVVEEGRRAVPAGLPFWVVSSEVTDTMWAEYGQWRAAWVLDADAIGRAPDGVGERE